MKILHVFTIFATAGFFDGQFRFLFEHGYEQIVACQDADTEGFCNRNNVRFIPIEVLRSISISGDIKTIRQLLTIIRKEKPDVIVGHTPKGAMVAMIAGWLARVPVRVYYRHGLIYTTASGLKRTILKSVERLTALLANRIINVSPSLSKLAVKDRLNGYKKQHVIGRGTCGGIDAINKFNPELVDSKHQAELRAKYNISEDDLMIGFCGRLCKDKGIIELIEGFNLFKSLHSEISAKLLLVGPYDSRDILPDNIKKEIENSDSIISTGRVTERIDDYYSLMDMFVFPSYREGFGMCVIEASAMEKPILVSRSHGCIDSIVENITGEYIDLSSEGIAEGIERMLDESRRRELGKNGRKFVLENFDHSVMWPKVLQLYSNIFKK